MSPPTFDVPVTLPAAYEVVILGLKRVPARVANGERAVLDIAVDVADYRVLLFPAEIEEERACYGRKNERHRNRTRLCFPPLVVCLCVPPGKHRTRSFFSILYIYA
jgi:hypothetical protein